MLHQTRPFYIYAYNQDPLTIVTEQERPNHIPDFKKTKKMSK